MILVKKQSYISEKGRRDNNEDNGGYNPGGSFVVCDGVGGSEKGEIASEIVVRRFLEDYKNKSNISAEDVLKIAEEDLSAHARVYPETMGMATTLTFSQIRENGVYVAWVGDSRIYQFRQGKIVFVTTDHSWVNEALKAGILSPEEAINHPKSNVITRAVQGSHKAAQIDDVLLTDVQKGDLFFHCSDGVLEAWEDDDLAALFASMNEPDMILQKIQEQCAISSRDNYTAIVYRIEESSLPKIKEPVFFDAIPVEDDCDSVSSENSKEKSKKSSFFNRWFLIIVLLLLASSAVLLFYNSFIKNTAETKPLQTISNTEGKKNSENLEKKTGRDKIGSSKAVEDENKDEEDNTNETEEEYETSALQYFSAEINEKQIYIAIDLSDAKEPQAHYYFIKDPKIQKKLTFKKVAENYVANTKIDNKDLRVELKGPDFSQLSGKYNQKVINFEKTE
jgi:serine/threonine protein phosphatase PrpC